MFKQRYNVAASRARDQMWVVHSLDARAHLKPGDLRRTLIEYAEDPTLSTMQLEAVKSKMESPFERDVAARLVRSGFHVTPQWRVGSFRIDLVVEGTGKRVAIECDGDKYHPLERLPDDMARQAVLERLGWTFLRMRGSQYFRDPEAAMASLIASIYSLGIEPTALDIVTETSAYVGETELLDRVRRRAKEIRRGWIASRQGEIEEEAA